MAKTKKFTISYTITLSGKSAEQPEGGTFLGNLLENAVKTFCEAVRLQWPNVKVEVKKND